MTSLYWARFIFLAALVVVIAGLGWAALRHAGR